MPTERAQRMPPVRRDNISPTDREDEKSPYYNAYRSECLVEAVTRGSGGWLGDPESCPQLGSWLKVALPSHDVEAARMRARGDHVIDVEHGCLKDTKTGAPRVFLKTVSLSKPSRNPARPRF